MNIGATIRMIRNRKKITIAQMSEGTGLSKGFISNMENNNTSPSIATLQTVATFLQVPLPYLLLKKDERMKVVRKNERHTTTHNKENITVEHITANNGLTLQHVIIPPGQSTGIEPHAHEGEESHIVLEGTIQAIQGEDEAILTEGDAFSWSACVPHSVTNIGETEAKVLIAVYNEQR